MPKNKLNRAKIKKLVKQSKPGKFYPTISEVLFWYDNLNQQVFKNELPPLTSVHFCKTKGYWAEANCEDYKSGGLVDRKVEFKMSYDYDSFKDFVEIIAHEMVHVWEHCNFKVMGHGKRFYSWAPELQKLGLKIAECQ